MKFIFQLIHLDKVRLHLVAAAFIPDGHKPAAQAGSPRLLYHYEIPVLDQSGTNAITLGIDPDVIAHTLVPFMRTELSTHHGGLPEDRPFLDETALPLSPLSESSPFSYRALQPETNLPLNRLESTFAGRKNLPLEGFHRPSGAMPPAVTTMWMWG